jgi:hypothetical protein
VPALLAGPVWFLLEQSYLEMLDGQAKPNLLTQIENARNNYVLGLAAMSTLMSTSAPEHLRISHVSFDGYVVPFERVTSILESESDRQIALREFLKMLLRALIKESFELIRSYAKATNQEAYFKSQSWYHFVRLIRNCLSHNFYFHFERSDLKLLPLTWNGHTIDSSMAGKPLPMNFLRYGGSWELFCELEKFAASSW